MKEEAKIGIPNRAHRRRHGQEGQSRCKLAMPKLAIYFGYHRPVGMRRPTGRSRRGAGAAHPGLSVGRSAADPKEDTAARRQVADWFFCVVQLRTVLVA